MEVDSDSDDEDVVSDDESEQEELYEVDKIVGMRNAGNDKKLFRVRWKGYTSLNDTWEPVENLVSCLDMVEEYERQTEIRKKQRSEERKKRMALMAGKVLSDEQSTDDESIPSSNTDPTSSGSTLKDTFWKDLEEGRINLFTTDMYSRVKGECRAARPVSFKDQFKTKSSKDENENVKSPQNTNDSSSRKKRLKRQREKYKSPKKDSHLKTKSRKRLRCRIKSNEFIMLSSSANSCSESEDGSSDVDKESVTDSNTNNITVSNNNDDKQNSVTNNNNDKFSLVSHNDSEKESFVLNNNTEKESSVLDNETEKECSVLDEIEKESCDKDAASGECYDERNKSTASCDISQAEPMDISTSSLDESSFQDRNEAKTCIKNCDNLKKTQHDISLRLECPDKLSPRKSVDKYSNPNPSSSTSHHRTDSVKKHSKHRHKSTEEPRSDRSVKHESKHHHRKRSTSDKESHKGQITPESAAKTSNKSSSSGKENISIDVSKTVPVSSGICALLSSKSSTSGHKDEKNASKVTRRKDSSEISQPLEKILSGSLLPILPENKTQMDKVFDLGFDIELDDIDLDELEQQLIHSPGIVHLTDDELQQAVVGGDYDLIKRAFDADCLFDIEQPDDNGNTLLMHAVLKNYDDIAEVLLCNGAKINAQQKQGNTALTTACEQAHICTVALLVEMGANVNLDNNAGETPLMKAVKRGHKQIVCYLLESGANFASLTKTGYSALTFAKLLRASDVEDIIVDHISKLTSEFEHQVSLTLNNTATIISALFPLQCFPLCDDKQFTIVFKNEAEPLTPGVGFLLFIAHAKFSPADVKCRLYGNCAVTGVVLNGIRQPSLTENANFVLSCHPLLRGKNELVIHTDTDKLSKAKLVVCAYKAQLLDVA
ncbi:M-phase phosphoprotein 8-like [Gigantopelta aegis]|uniref:M-phase phosphoprotein 8-like n=1 Tax=Gigantopelta aegis TaxID=1735272 RepID=UPI001B88DBB8|nr:M-phase phosphoprotein 8-like [Gigantopelta aegis]